jgi:hypothetical protein
VVLSARGVVLSARAPTLPLSLSLPLSLLLLLSLSLSDWASTEREGNVSAAAEFPSWPSSPSTAAGSKLEASVEGGALGSRRALASAARMRLLSLGLALRKLRWTATTASCTATCTRTYEGTVCDSSTSED